MLFENSFKLNWDFANKVFPLENALEKQNQNLLLAKNKLLNKKGESSELTDWIPFLKNSSLQCIQDQKLLVKEIQENCDAIVIIGIGGSLLGTKALYEALTSKYSRKNKFPILLWAGHHLAQEDLIELCQALDEYNPNLIVISKSGNTTEPALAFRILKQYLDHRFGAEKAQKRIFAITDPNHSALLSIAKKNQYPHFDIPSGIGGRYSIFTSVGLFPLALAGINVSDFVEGAIHAHDHCVAVENNSYKNNNALCYAGVRNILYENGYKIEALCTWTPKANAIAEWWKQLFGESDGKNNTGLFPSSANFSTDLHSLGQYFQQGERHLISTHLKFKEKGKLKIPSSSFEDGLEYLSNTELNYVQEKAQEGSFLAHSDGKIPVLIWELSELSAYSIGAWMFTNMFACAVGGYARNINPFNQPGVEDYKRNMFKLMNK